MMRLGTILWMVVLALCVVGTIYEMPNAMLNLRALRHLFVDPEDAPERAVPDKLVAMDPEAGDILRYAIKYRYYVDDPNIDILKPLVAKHPRNEYLLSELAEQSVRMEHVDANDVLAVIDRLRELDPNNAHTLYLKGWALLRMPGGEQRVREALSLFDQGDRLPRFYLPYLKYKPRVDRLAEKAVLRRFHRPRIRSFYGYLGELVAESFGWKGLDQESLRELVAAGSRIADRVIDNAYDMDSLGSGAEAIKEIEQARRGHLDLSEAEASRAWRRLSRAAAMEDLSWRWPDDIWLTESSGTDVMPWLMLVFLPVFILQNRSRHKQSEISTADKKRGTSGYSYYGAITLIGLVTFIAIYRWLPNGWEKLFCGQLSWFMVIFSLISYPQTLTHANSLNRRQLWRMYGLFWLNGTLLLLIGNSSFFWSRDFTGWSQSLGLLLVWLVFCLLLWYLASHGQPAFGPISYVTAAVLVFTWAVVLLALDVEGSRWHYGSRAYAEPLAVYGPVPAAKQSPQEPDATIPPG